MDLVLSVLFSIPGYERQSGTSTSQNWKIAGAKRRGIFWSILSASRVRTKTGNQEQKQLLFSWNPDRPVFVLSCFFLDPKNKKLFLFTGLPAPKDAKMEPQCHQNVVRIALKIETRSTSNGAKVSAPSKLRTTFKYPGE